RALYDTRRRINEQRNPDARLTYPGDDVSEKINVLQRIPSGVGSKDVRTIRHERCLRRFDLADNIEKTLIRISLDIELGFYDILQRQNIAVSDMSFVRSGMHRNSLGTEAFTVDGRLYHIGIISS